MRKACEAMAPRMRAGFLPRTLHSVETHGEASRLRLCAPLHSIPESLEEYPEIRSTTPPDS